MLANVIVFEWFKTFTRVTESELKNSFFLLDLETLEGNWHSYFPHPLVDRRSVAASDWVQDLDLRLEQGSDGRASNELFPYFNRLTSAQTGIFHIWEEGDLKQLPLSQCRVQAIDPLSEGPASLLPAKICSGLTHQEARREAGLAGIEAYVFRLAGALVDSKEFVGVGAGETIAESVSRGLQACLTEQLGRQLRVRKPTVNRVEFSRVEDARSRFYIQSLTTMQGAPIIGLGENLYGFPVVWVGTGDRWYGTVGLNKTMALRQTLQAALLKLQNQLASHEVQVLEISSVNLGAELPIRLEISSTEETKQLEILENALEILKLNGMYLSAMDLAVEPFLRESLGGVFGVVLREGESR
jgi:putative thiazole-containing bacteriocin maturation protein